MKAKINKIFLNDSGSYLGREQGCLIVRNRKREVEKYPLFENEIGEVRIKIGNSVSSGALATCAFWKIPVLILTQRGNPVAILKSLDDDSHVKTRICQYEAIRNGKSVEIAKKVILAKIGGQNQVLKKYGLRQHDIIKAKETINKIESDKLSSVRKQLLSIEGRLTDYYFHQIFRLLPKSIMIDKRRTYKAYDGINNIFNLCYSILKWKVYTAVIRAKLEPFLGFLHSEQFAKPSLVCDLMEIYRPLVDDFILQYSKSLGKKDFILKQEAFSSKRKGQRQFLNKPLTKDLMKKLNSLFESKVEIPRIKHGKKQEIESLISEEAQQLAKYLREEKKEWAPRVPLV